MKLRLWEFIKSLHKSCLAYNARNFVLIDATSHQLFIDSVKILFFCSSVTMVIFSYLCINEPDDMKPA